MSAPLLLAVDNGLTVTKAVVFDDAGGEVAVAEESITRLHPHPRHVERDMDESWAATARAIRRVLAAPGADAGRIAAVGVTAHGDGIYLVDADGRPAAPGVLSLDSRAVDIMADWGRGGVLERALELTGQYPHVSAPAALLAWFARERPDRLDRARWVMAGKDWIRLCLTGEVATDRTEASQSFTDLETQEYSGDALSLYGLDGIAGKLPPILSCDSVAGHVTAEAAAATGLRAGTPVAAGLHDVTAAAIGVGNVAPGGLTLVAGTYSINETISRNPVREPRSACRASFRAGEWMNMSISPASSANVDWFLNRLCPAELAAAERSGGSVFDTLQPEIEAAAERGSRVMFHPFLYGSPLSDFATAGFFGLKGWHGRGDMLLALLEGIAFNHRTHVDVLKARFGLNRVRATGGGTRNPLLLQLFADNLRLSVETVAANEVSALGTAICAGVASGVYPDVETGAEAAVCVAGVRDPEPAAFERVDDRYGLYLRVAEALQPLWPEFNEAED